jgi:glycosyltransferase involved in cell wall biosynthesis
MRIIFVQTYPIYHGFTSLTQWWNHIDRERVMAALLAKKGYQVEIWAAADNEETRCMAQDHSGSHMIRVFPVKKKGSKSKYHFSDALVEFAKCHSSDYFILKGVDGGVGRRLLDQYLYQSKKPFAFILGGEYSSKYLSRADIIFFESSLQKNKILKSRSILWRRSKMADKLVRLPKWVDIKLFTPQNNPDKKWDIIVVGRLISYYKDFSALKILSQHLRVAVAGDGPMAKKLQVRYPRVKWLGYVPHASLPKILNQACILMHTSFRDFYPRIIAEAMACGLPCVAFNNNITTDVIPGQCGLLVNKNNFLRLIKQLLDNKDRLKQMSLNAREYAVAHVVEQALEHPLHHLVTRAKLKCRHIKNGHAK